MGRRRSKWRRTTQIVKKMMQEARKTRALQSLRQCPVCGNPYSLSITIKVDKEVDKKSAKVYCTACGFEYEFPEIPVIADEFWVYSRTLDIVQGAPRKVEAFATEEVLQSTIDVGKSEKVSVSEEVEAEIVEEVEAEGSGENIENVDVAEEDES